MYNIEFGNLSAQFKQKHAVVYFKLPIVVNCPSSKANAKELEGVTMEVVNRQ